MVLFVTLWSRADNIMEMQMVSSVQLRQTLLTDSLTTKGKRPDGIELLFQSQQPMQANGNISEVISADTAGWMVLPKVERGYRMYALQTQFRADRYASATFQIKTPVRMEAYINGKKMTDKMTVQDSLHLSSTAHFNLKMEPETLYKLVVKVLSAETDSCAPALHVNYRLADDTITHLAVNPDLKGRYLVHHTICGERVTGVSISPDGNYVLTTYNCRYAYDNAYTYKVLSDVKSGRQIAVYPSGSKNLSWMPQSTLLYYTERADKGYNVMTVHPKTLEEKVVAERVPGNVFRWSPDEKALYYTQTEQLAGDEGPVRRLLTPQDRIPNNRGRSFIWRYDIATGVYERLTCGYHSTSLQDISADGRWILYSVHQSTPSQWPFSKKAIYCMDVTTMQVDTLIKEDAFISSAHFSPDANAVLLTGGPEALGGIGKNCGEHPIANNYDTQAFIMNRLTREVEPITKNFDPSVDFVQWNRKDGCIYFKTSDKDEEPVYCYHPQKRTYQRLPLDGDCIKTFSMANDGTMAAYVTSTAEYSLKGCLYNVRKQQSASWADPYAKTLSELEMGEIKDWSFTASDGTDITGFYCLPPSFDAHKFYPMIVYYYSGTTPTVRSLDNPYAAQLFASRGYVALVINPSGAIGFGQEFSARHVNAWGKRTADDIIEGVKAFCAEHSFVDATKVGCLGASYGGFMTQYLQTRTDIFAAAVSHAGISDVTSYWGEGYWGVGYNAVAAAQSYPWNHPELFTQQGSLFNADQINTPLLLLHGMVDTNVPIGESIQLYNALKVLGKTVEFIQVEGENHFISDVNKRQLWHNSIMAWFERWLKGDSRWWDAIYPKRMLER